MHAAARIDRLLPVVRHVIDEAADQRVRHQPAGSDAAIDDLGHGGLLHQLLAAAAGPLAVDVPVHEELGRHDVQPLADVLAHAHHGRAAAAVSALGLVAVLNAPQVFGQQLAARFPGRGLGRVGRVGKGCLQGSQLRLQAGLVLGHRLFEQSALLRVHGLAAGTKLPALQARQLEGDLLQLGVPPGDLTRLAGDQVVAAIKLLLLRKQPLL